MTGTPTYELIKDEYACEARGSIAVKGRGEMETYLLTSKRDPSRATGNVRS